MDPLRTSFLMNSFPQPLNSTAPRSENSLRIQAMPSGRRFIPPRYPVEPQEQQAESGGQDAITFDRDNPAQLKAFTDIFELLKDKEFPALGTFTRRIIANLKKESNLDSIRFFFSKTVLDFWSEDRPESGQDLEAGLTANDYSKITLTMLDNCKVTREEMNTALHLSLGYSFSHLFKKTTDFFLPAFQKENHSPAVTVVPGFAINNHVMKPTPERDTPDMGQESTETVNSIQYSIRSKSSELIAGHTPSGNNTMIHYSDIQLGKLLIKYGNSNELNSFLCNTLAIKINGVERVLTEKDRADFEELPLKVKFIFLKQLINQYPLNHHPDFAHWLESKIKPSVKTVDSITDVDVDVDIDILLAEINSYTESYGEESITQIIELLAEEDECHQSCQNEHPTIITKHQHTTDQLAVLMLQHGLTFEGALKLIECSAPTLTEETGTNHENRKPDSAPVEKENSYPCQSGRHLEQQKIAQPAAMLPTPGIPEITVTAELPAALPEGPEEPASTDSLTTCHSLSEQDIGCLESGFDELSINHNSSDIYDT